MRQLDGMFILGGLYPAYASIDPSLGMDSPTVKDGGTDLDSIHVSH
jgi:hypothetical protein